MFPQYDVTFIGSGHAAWHAALTLKHAGKEVAIIEKERIASSNTSNGFSSKILALQPQFVHVPAIRSFSIIATSLPA
jgi:phytoene dehydrogenase-like protein